MTRTLGLHIPDLSGIARDSKHFVICSCGFEVKGYSARVVEAAYEFHITSAPGVPSDEAKRLELAGRGRRQGPSRR